MSLPLAAFPFQAVYVQVFFGWVCHLFCHLPSYIHQLTLPFPCIHEPAMAGASFPLRQGAKYLTGLLGRASAAAGDEAASAAIATELQDLAPRGEHVNTATALAAVKTHGATKLSA